MDDELKELEDELRRLRPRVPSAALDEALGRAWAERAPRRRYATATSWTSWKWAHWGAVAALLAVVAALQWRAGGRAAADAGARAAAGGVAAELAAARPEGFVPVTADRTLVRARDEGLVVMADGTAGRRVRSEFVDTIVWHNPSTNASLSWSLPREEVQVVPVHFN